MSRPADTVFSGDRDPVAGPDAVGKARPAVLWDVGVQDVTLTLTPGRHEMLNETNRDEVTAEILAFWTVRWSSLTELDRPVRGRAVS